MYRNYFYLLRSVNDISHELIGTRITDVYSQEKDKLFLKIPSNEFPNRHLIIDTNPHSTSIFLKDVHFKAKKNFMQFFDNALNKKVHNVEIAENDRIVKFNLGETFILFSIKGNKTNIFYSENLNEVQSFKKSNNDDIKKDLKQIFFSGSNHPSIFNRDYAISDLNELKKLFPMLSNEIKIEIDFRISENENSIWNIFQNIVREFLNEDIRVGFSIDLQKMMFFPSTFKTIITEDNYKDFSNFNDALQYYSASFYRLNAKSNFKNELEKYFDTEISNLSAKLNNLKIRIENGSNENLYYSYGNTLLSNMDSLKKGMKEIILKSNEGTDELRINLDPKLNPNENINKYFEKAKDEKINFNKSVELFESAKQKYNTLLTEYDYFKNADTIDKIEYIYNKLITKKENIIKMDSGEKFKYWLYLIDDKYSVYIGRDSKSNDYLSVKFAKQNDYWFHARGLPGSHVVLRVENLKEVMPKEIIKKTASLAAYYSKAKTAGTAPVSYTFAKFVHKKKGMEPGKVILQKEYTILVKPEIPQNCVLVNE
ncbi:MAG: DUF814 domain-containing protein [Ignavibacteriales bacterium]|nr:DUF814 domain-containing protein [Ignavibacteriales bacterium]